MAVLPEEFIQQTRLLMGDERFSRYLDAFNQQTPVSIRLNPLKMAADTSHSLSNRVPWCRNAFYLDRRPNFTLDPLLHAGCYYVQEAASMFLDEILCQHLPLLTPHLTPLTALDMCAAPGGKSTCAISALPTGSVLYANEPVRNRASILLENITKWGYPNCHVTNNYPHDYTRSGLTFDVILCDVPCSGEGMFRRDSATIGQWSIQNVEKCWRLQRDIVSDAWQCLRPGGLFIYSTCTFNTKENEENVRWMLDSLDARLLPVDTSTEWGITGSLLPGFSGSVYRFIPGITRSEGLFMCVMRKKGAFTPSTDGSTNSKHWQKHASALHTLQPIDNLHIASPRVELSYEQAIAYLRREALVLPPDTPHGVVEMCYKGQGLGTVKNIGSRANNLYPKEWRIRTTHTSAEDE